MHTKIQNALGIRLKHPINNLILNGFDRCGSSAIARVLSKHPDIELIFQPFNSGNIRRIMYQIMSEQNAKEEDYRFFSEYNP